MIFQLQELYSNPGEEVGYAALTISIETNKSDIILPKDPLSPLEVIDGSRIMVPVNETVIRRGVDIEKIPSSVESNYDDIRYAYYENGILKIGLPDSKNEERSAMYDVRIYDMSGREVNITQDYAKDLNIQFNGIRGAYFVRIESDNFNFSTKFIIP